MYIRLLPLLLQHKSPQMVHYGRKHIEAAKETTEKMSLVHRQKERRPMQHISSPVLTHSVLLHFQERELSKSSVQSYCVAPIRKLFISMLLITFYLK